MSNLKISEFVYTNELQDSDDLPIIRGNGSSGYDNYRTSIASLANQLSNYFTPVAGFGEFVDEVNAFADNVSDQLAYLDDAYNAGDQAVTSNLSGVIISYYDILNGKILDLTSEHNRDISILNTTMQDWITVIDAKADSDELLGFDNRLTTAENLLTRLSEIVYEYAGSSSGGGGGGIPGYHTQSTATIYPLTGYYRTGSMESLSTSDTLNQALGKLESRILNVEQTGGGGGTGVYLITTGDITQPTNSNAYSAARSNLEHLSATADDTADGYIKFNKGWQGGQLFTPGFMGSGASLYPVNGKWNLEVDNLVVRGSTQFNELVINEIKAIGGDLLLTVGDMVITNVETLDAQSVYRCYFDTQDGTVLNKFVALDQAICQKFDGHDMKRYWRLVSSVGENYVDLSMTDAEAGSSIPEVGDILIQLGNRTNDSRRSAIWLSAASTGGPQITMYENITGFDLTNKQRTTIGSESKFVGTMYQTTQTGDLVQVPRDLGQFVVGSTYYYYDRVSYNGSLWLCVATITTEAPSVSKPDVWQLQVAKGDAGQTGSDVGQWVEIMGQTLFLYPEPGYTGTPTPAILSLEATLHNITNPTIVWEILETGSILEYTGTSCQIYPEHFGQYSSIVLKCTATDETGTFSDETQLAKLTNGESGENAVYIAMSNDNMSVPYTNDGQNPLVALSEITTTISVYQGTTPVEPSDISYSLVSGTATFTLVGNALTLTSLTSPSARVRVTVTIGDGQFSRDLWITKIFNGPSGEDGANAAYVIVTGEQTFKVNSDTTISPASITLTAVPYNIPGVSYRWYWSIAGENDWNAIEGATSSTYEVTPTGAGFDSGADEVSFKCECQAEYGSITYSDLVTINKLHDGKDGQTIYHGILSNENQTVTSHHNGSVDVSNIARVKSNYTLFYGTTELAYGSDYTLRIIQPDATNLSTLSNDTDNKVLQLASLSTPHDTTVFKVEFINHLNQVVDVVDFTISKSKNGAPGDYEVSVYAYKASTPSKPTFRAIPSGAGEAGPDGTIWYTTPPAGTPIYMAQATFSGTDNLAILREDGGYWTNPISISGVPGADGAAGPRGEQGATGSPGPTGPGMVFRGVWNSSTYYYLSEYQADVVRSSESGPYYIRYGVSGSTRNSYTNTSYWRQLSTFESVATNLLFASTATIAGWNFNNDYIWSQDRRCYLDGTGGTKGTPVISLGENSMSTGLVPSQTAKVRLYANGTIVVGEGEGTDGNAGIVGESENGASSIRFWAGNTLGNRYSAPFRVTQGGNLTANNATITGTFQTGTSGSRLFVGNAADGQHLKGYANNGTPTVYISFSSPMISLERVTSDKTATSLWAGYTNYYSPYKTYTAVCGWENYGSVFGLGPTVAGRWPSTADGGRVWRDSNGFLRAS